MLVFLEGDFGSSTAALHWAAEQMQPNTQLPLVPAAHFMGSHALPAGQASEQQRHANQKSCQLV